MNIHSADVAERKSPLDHQSRGDYSRNHLTAVIDTNNRNLAKTTPQGKPPKCLIRNLTFTEGERSFIEDHEVEVVTLVNDRC